MIQMNDNETKVALFYGRIIIACLAIIIAFYGLDVPIPVIA